MEHKEEGGGGKVGRGSLSQRRRISKRDFQMGTSRFATTARP